LLVKWLFGYGNVDPDELTIFPGNCGIGIKAELKIINYQLEL